MQTPHAHCVCLQRKDAESVQMDCSQLPISNHKLVSVQQHNYHQIQMAWSLHLTALNHKSVMKHLLSLHVR